MSTESHVHSLTLPRARLRSLAGKLVALAPTPTIDKLLEQPIKVVCISDTHNHQPELPSGDLLLHAGDLSEWGSFDEIQKQLSWISSQPHTYKVVIAGNHDVLFDQTFLDSGKERFPVKDGQTAANLDFGSVIYLQDSATTLNFAQLHRQCTVYGSPWTPKYVKSAFQYSYDDDVWSQKNLNGCDILLSHGPPYGYLDGPRHSGCRYLAQLVEEQQPRLVVFGHIHNGYGREKVKFDCLRRLYGDVERGWSGWEVIPAMILLLAWMKVCSVLRSLFGFRMADHMTELINAAVMDIESKPRDKAMVTYI